MPGLEFMVVTFHEAVIILEEQVILYTMTSSFKKWSSLNEMEMSVKGTLVDEHWTHSDIFEILELRNGYSHSLAKVCNGIWPLPEKQAWHG